MRIEMKTGLAVVGALLLSPAAFAQTAAPSAQAGSFTPDEVKKFATAAIALNRIQADASVAVADKQPMMLAAVQKAGLPPEKFNAIAKAAETDPALQKQIQAAASAQGNTPSP